MQLRKLYTNPGDIFDSVDFKPGLNLVFGHKDPSLKGAASLNGIGKSTFLDLIDFCLLGSYTKVSTNRLHLAGDILKEHQIALDFTSGGSNYTIMRSIDNPNVVEFTADNVKSEMAIKEAKSRLSKIIFFNPNYQGKYLDSWYRQLMNVFLKIHKTKSVDRFIDPINYLANVPMYELIPLHLLLLGIDNTLACKNRSLQADKKMKLPTLKGVKSIVEDTYNVSDIKDANEHIFALQSEIRKLESAVSSFRLSKNYKASEKDVDLLTKDIKSLLVQNMADHKRVQGYEESLEVYASFTKRDSDAVAKIYKELNEAFAESVKVTLDAAIDFRKKLAEAREEFIGDELLRLRQVTKERAVQLAKLDDKRASILDFLKSKEAIKDLTEAFSVLSDKKTEMSDLRSKLETYNTLEQEKADIEADEKLNDAEGLSFIQKIKFTEISNLHELFMDVYSTIYNESSKPSFNMIYKPKSDAKIDIQVSIPADNSKANNQGRTLVYDLTLMLHMILKGIPGPRFLIHDGIFDGMDKAHFINLHTFMNENPKASEFQYILTFNEEGELTAPFGATDGVSVQHLKEDSILTLTPDKKFLGVFDKK